MQARSRMATWMLAVCAVGAGGFVTSICVAADPAPVKQQVKLIIRLDGTEPNSGVEVLIKPGHPASRFKPVSYPVKLDGTFRDIPPIDVETVSADRDCAFAIVLKVPGEPDKVFRRSLQIAAPTEATAGKPQVLQCYLSSRGVGARVAGGAARPVDAKPAEPTRKR